MKSLLWIMVAACSSSAERSWWCTDTVCQATKEECTRMQRALHLGGSCKPQRTAVCSHGCEEIDGEQRCSPRCTVDHEMCTVETARGSSCREEPPPAHPELYPEYVEPGWWCGEIETGKSVCEKAKALCENALHVECKRATGSVYCWSYRTIGANARAIGWEGKLAFVCATTPSFCEQTLANVKASSTEMQVVSGCSLWPYD